MIPKRRTDEQPNRDRLMRIWELLPLKDWYDRRVAMFARETRKSVGFLDWAEFEHEYAELRRAELRGRQQDTIAVALARIESLAPVAWERMIRAKRGTQYSPPP